jgi:hypothetical protein
MALLGKAVANGVPACPRRHASIGALVPVCPMGMDQDVGATAINRRGPRRSSPGSWPSHSRRALPATRAAKGMLAQLEPGTGTLRRFVEVSPQRRLDDRPQADLALNRKLLGPLKQASSISTVVFI